MKYNNDLLLKRFYEWEKRIDLKTGNYENHLNKLIHKIRERRRMILEKLDSKSVCAINDELERLIKVVSEKKISTFKEHEALEKVDNRLLNVIERNNLITKESKSYNSLKTYYNPGIKNEFRYLGQIKPNNQPWEFCQCSQRKYYRLLKVYEQKEMKKVALESKRKGLTAFKRKRSQKEIIILQLASQKPELSYYEIARELKASGELMISHTAVYKIFTKYNITSPDDRKTFHTLSILRSNIGQSNTRVSELKIKFPALYPGSVCVLFSFCPGKLRFINDPVTDMCYYIFFDNYSKFILAKVYSNKNSKNATNFLNASVVPFFNEHSVTINKILVNKGEIDSRFHQKLNIEEYSEEKTWSNNNPEVLQTVEFREKLIDSIKRTFLKHLLQQNILRNISELQTKLDNWVDGYNKMNQPTKFCFGQSPSETLNENFT